MEWSKGCDEEVCTIFVLKFNIHLKILVLKISYENQKTFFVFLRQNIAELQMKEILQPIYFSGQLELP